MELLPRLFREKNGDDSFTIFIKKKRGKHLISPFFNYICLQYVHKNIYKKVSL